MRSTIAWLWACSCTRTGHSSHAHCCMGFTICHWICAVAEGAEPKPRHTEKTKTNDRLRPEKGISNLLVVQKKSVRCCHSNEKHRRTRALFYNWNTQKIVLAIARRKSQLSHTHTHKQPHILFAPINIDDTNPFRVYPSAITSFTTPTGSIAYLFRL